MSDTDVGRAVNRVLVRANAKFDRAIAELHTNMPAPLPKPQSLMEAWGQIARAFNDSVVEAGRQFARGYNAIERGSNY